MAVTKAIRVRLAGAPMGIVSVPSCGAVSAVGLLTSTQLVASESGFSFMSLGTLSSAACEGEWSSSGAH